jgi:SAM-dependent methyltransferase
MQQGVLERMLHIEERHWWFRARQEILLDLLRRWVPAGGRVLDVGCGTGYFLGAANQEWEVWGLDPAPEAVAFCHTRGLTRVRQGTSDDLRSLDLPQVDAVTFFDVLEHLDNDQAALEAARTRLEPGGMVLATVPAYPWLWSQHDEWNHHRRRYTTKTLGSLLRSAGLEPTVLTYYNSRLFPLAVLSRLLTRRRGEEGPSESLLPVPAAPLNQLLYRVFRSEGRRLTGSQPHPFRFGLSLLTVARSATHNKNPT